MALTDSSEIMSNLNSASKSSRKITPTKAKICSILHIYPLCLLLFWQKQPKR